MAWSNGDAKAPRALCYMRRKQGFQASTLSKTKNKNLNPPMGTRFSISSLKSFFVLFCACFFFFFEEEEGGSSRKNVNHLPLTYTKLLQHMSISPYTYQSCRSLSSINKKIPFSVSSFHHCYDLEIQTFHHCYDLEIQSGSQKLLWKSKAQWRLSNNSEISH